MTSVAIATIGEPTAADFMRKPIRVRSGITHLTYDPSGRLLATSDAYMMVKVSDREAVRLERDFNVFDDRIRSTQRIRSLSFSKDGRILFVSAADTVHAVQVDSGESIWTYTPPRSFGFLVSSPLSADAANGLLCATFDNGSIGVWEEDGSPKSLWHHNDAPRTLFFGADPSMLIGTDSFTLTAWDWANRRRLTRIPLRDRAYGLVVSRKSDRAAVWTMSGVQVYSMQSAEMVMELSAGMGLPVMAFDSVTDAIAIAERNGVRIYDASGQELSNHPIDSRSILSLAFSPGGSELSIGCSDSLVRTLQI